MNKICTSIEQSKKLIELGIDTNTADMCYFPLQGCNGNIHYNLFAHKEIIGIHSWSLSALLGLMPKLYEFENDPDDGGCQPNLCKGWDINQWHIVYRPSIYITEWYENPIDAAFEMVVWLKKNNKI